ncbi:F-box/FBD/LRR-repeat protein At5g53840-like isoform X2 [Cannabis sativa]|nr:F-box/FBD/LRR-repeat protein At5g53840-like isoform X2 [Cannabis sativa]
MAEKRAKTTLMVDEEEDRFYKLPDSLIQHILSFLSTKEAVSTCLVSNRWKLMWYSVPKLSFSDFDRANNQKKLYSYVNNYLEHRKRGMKFIPDSAITSFKLHINCYQRSKSRDLDKWLAFIVNKKVKEINLRVNKKKTYRGDIHYYSLPKTLAVKARYLTKLKLNSVELDSRYSFSFPSLKTLKLACVRLADNDVVDKLLMGSPSLEKLQLRFYCQSSDPQLRINLQHSLSLKSLRITLSVDLVEKINVINLEFLSLMCVDFAKIRVSACKAIRILNLSCYLGMEDLSSLEYLISNLPLLEEFTFTKVHKWKLKHIEISNQHLVKLIVQNFFGEELNVILKSTPKLTTVVYTGCINLSVSMESSNLLFGTFVIHEGQENYDTDWFLDFTNFLLNLKCSWRSIDIHVKSDKALIFPEKLKRVCRSPLVDWKNLTFSTEYELKRESNLKDALQWISPTLSLKKGRHFYKSSFKVFENFQKNKEAFF